MTIGRRLTGILVTLFSVIAPTISAAEGSHGVFNVQAGWARSWENAEVLRRELNVPGGVLTGGLFRVPRIPVDIQRLPDLELAVETVVIESGRGECAESFAPALARSLSDAGATVLSQSGLREGLGELDDAAGGIAAYSAERIREMYGVTVSLAIHVVRCEYGRERDHRDLRRRDGIVQQHFATTEVFLTVEAEVTEVGTGEYLATYGGNFNRRRTNHDFDQRPQFPVVGRVQDLSFRAAARQVRRALLPWTETVEIVLYDYEECRMREAYVALKAGLNDEAERVTIAGLETCRHDPEMRRDRVARALYNRGMMSVVSGKDEEALGFLQESEAMMSGNVAGFHRRVMDDAIEAARSRISDLRERRDAMRRAPGGGGTARDRNGSGNSG